MSYEAFELLRLVDKLPLRICAIAAWEHSFLLSTVSPKNEAHLILYNIQKSADFDKDYEAKLMKTMKRFTTKPVTQLVAVPEHNIFLGLSDGEVFFGDIETFTILGHIAKSKGALHFAVDWQHIRPRAGFGRELRIAIATRRKLQLYEWKRNTFVVLKTDLNFPDNPRSFAWVGDGLIVCFKKDLYLVSMDGDTKELFPIGVTRVEPCFLPLMSGEILVLKDEMQISLDARAKPTQSQPLVWSDQPVAIEHVHPYIVGLLPRGIEIRALEQKIQVQQIKPVDQIKFITSGKDTLLASQNSVFMLEPKAYDDQVKQLVQGKHFDLALSIAELIEEPLTEKQSRKDEILRRYAFYQFTQHRFEESLKNYLAIKEDPVNVIGLYPNLLPSELRQSLSHLHPTKPPTLSGDSLDEGMKHLTAYLTQMRYQEQQKLQKHQKEEQTLPSEEVKKVKERLKLIDTTLLKCYIKTGNNTLIGSLVRLPDNHLHIEESERVLRNEDKFKELIDLYQSNKLHQKALQLLLQFSRGPSSHLSGVWPTIHYLQNLGAEHIQLILEYSKDIIQKRPLDALRIFTEDIMEVRYLPRATILEHLKNTGPELEIPYLEHVIHHWEDESPQFHNRLVQLYKKRVEVLLAQYKTKNKGRPRARAGEEPGDLGVLRTKLLKFLSSSRRYTAADHISSLPQDDMFEERALLLSGLGRHELALAIYAHVLKEPELAEDYCRKTYDSERDDCKDVYLSLIKMYLTPPNLTEYGIRLSEGTRPESNVDDALRVLTLHHDVIDTTKVLDLLPEETKIGGIEQFLSTVVHDTTLHRRRSQLFKSLVLAEHLQVQKERIREQSPHFTLQDDTACDACHKRLGTSAFARYPNGSVEHLFCAKEKDLKMQRQKSPESSASIDSDSSLS